MNDYLANVYAIKRPAGPAAPLVFDSPHSGTIYPDDFGYACDPHLLARAEDTYVDDLFSAVPDAGGTLLSAAFPRTYIDVNRAESDIDEELLSGAWPLPVSADGRASAGHGLVRRLIRPGYPIYDRRLSVSDVMHRIETYYRPYHAALEQLLDETYTAHGQVWHINCHSMPSTSAYASPGRPVDFVLGTRDGTTCSGDFAREMKEFLRRAGYRVAINAPYKGMEILRRYGEPMGQRHSLQVEISKALYLDEKTNEKSAQYVDLKSTVTKLIGFVRDYAEQSKLPVAAD